MRWFSACEPIQLARVNSRRRRPWLNPVQRSGSSLRQEHREILVRIDLIPNRPGGGDGPQDADERVGIDFGVTGSGPVIDAEIALRLRIDHPEFDPEAAE